MKITAYILALAISFLTFQPVMSRSCMSNSNYSVVHDCCKGKHAHSSKRDSRNCCDNGVCNPFAMCNCCAVNNSVRTHKFLLFSTVTKFDAYADDKFISSYSADCFHPPEIV